MDDLIEALTIVRKYVNRPFPTGCDHDVLYVYGIPSDIVSPEDAVRLRDLGFMWETVDTLASYHFGSA